MPRFIIIAFLALPLLSCCHQTSSETGLLDPWCDQAITEWFIDADGDHQGNPNEIIEICGSGLDQEGISMVGTDCDDTDPEIYERVYCTDADCDGYKTDTGGTCTRQCSGTTWSYVDDKGVEHCFSSREEYDCDDTDPEVYPGQGC